MTSLGVSLVADATLLFAICLQLLARLKAMCTEGGPAAVKAAAKALVVLAGQDKAAEVAGELADSLLDRLKASPSRIFNG